MFHLPGWADEWGDPLGSAHSSMDRFRAASETIGSCGLGGCAAARCRGMGPSAAPMAACEPNWPAIGSPGAADPPNGAKSGGSGCAAVDGCIAVDGCSDGGDSGGAKLKD